MNVTILAANGQIAHLVEERLLTEPTFKDIQLTLMLRHPERFRRQRTPILSGQPSWITTKLTGQPKTSLRPPS